MFKITHRLFSSPLRLSTRVNLTTAARASRPVVTRRMMSSESHTSHGGSAPNDRLWMIGSALVFGPLFLYLVSPSARKGSHGHHEHQNHRGEHADKHAQQVQSQPDVPVADDEGTEVSGQEVKESMEKAFEADSPKDAQEHEEAVAETKMTAEESSTTEAQTPAEPLATGAALASEPVLNPSVSVTDDEANSTRVVHATSDEKIEAPPVSEPVVVTKA